MREARAREIRDGKEIATTHPTPPDPHEHSKTTRLHDSSHDDNPTPLSTNTVSPTDPKYTPSSSMGTPPYQSRYDLEGLAYKPLSLQDEVYRNDAFV